jgi:hypothetical protein
MHTSGDVFTHPHRINAGSFSQSTAMSYGKTISYLPVTD